MDLLFTFEVADPECQVFTVHIQVFVALVVQNLISNLFQVYLKLCPDRFLDRGRIDPLLFSTRIISV